VSSGANRFFKESFSTLKPMNNSSFQKPDQGHQCDRLANMAPARPKKEASVGRFAIGTAPSDAELVIASYAMVNGF
jgi:hypothetical protein